MNSSQSEPQCQPGPASIAVRSTVNLLLFLHLFVVAVALSGNFAPSGLQRRLLEVFAPYTRTLNFDLNYTPYYLTRGTEADVDHRIEILPRGASEARAEDWLSLPDVGLRGGERYQRYQRLAATFAFLAADDTVAGQLAQAIGTHFSRRERTVPAQIRCRSHFLQSMEVVGGGNANERDPYNAIYYRVPYAANCVVGRDGLVSIVKIDEASQVARPNLNRDSSTNRPPSPQ